MSDARSLINVAPARGACVIDVLDRGLQLGDGVFDTLVAPDGHPFALDAHATRLVDAAVAIGIPCNLETLRDSISAAARIAEGEDRIIRTTITRGTAARGLWPAGEPSPTLICTSQPWNRRLVGEPARLVTAPIPRNQASPLSRIKSLAYLDNILCARHAAEAGADDALILNTLGRVCCTTICNLFALRGKTLATPPVEDGCLDGIIRGLVIDASAGLGLDVRLEPMQAATLLEADAVFLTNSVRIIRPVADIDGTSIKGSPTTARLLGALIDRIGTDCGTTIAQDDISQSFEWFAT